LNPTQIMLLFPWRLASSDWFKWLA